jgi:Flp pilus assembly protein TadG
MRPDLPQTLKRFWRSRRGVAAVEFALLVPVLLVTYLGATDLTQGLAIDRKLGQLSATVGDLVARESDIDENKVLAFFDTGSAIMRPFDFESTTGPRR